MFLPAANTEAFLPHGNISPRINGWQESDQLNFHVVSSRIVLVTAIGRPLFEVSKMVFLKIVPSRIESVAPHPVWKDYAFLASLACEDNDTVSKIKHLPWHITSLQLEIHAALLYSFLLLSLEGL